MIEIQKPEDSTVGFVEKPPRLEEGIKVSYLADLTIDACVHELVGWYGNQNNFV